MAHFTYDPVRGMERHKTRAEMDAVERIEFALTDGLPDEELTAPISAWGSCRVAEFGGPLASELVALEGK